MEKAHVRARLAVKSVSPEQKTITAIVTAPTLDRDGEVVDTPSLRIPLKGGGFKYARELTGEEQLAIPLQADHSRSVYDTIGSARNARINDAGELEVTFAVSSRAKAQELLTLLQEGHLDNAFSISYLYSWEDITDGVIYDAEVTEISLVWRGANYDARLLAVSKSLEKGSNMSKQVSPELAEKKAKLEETIKAAEELQAEIEAAEAANNEPETPEGGSANPEDPKNPELGDKGTEGEEDKNPNEPEAPEEPDNPDKTPTNDLPETPEGEGEKGNKTVDKTKSIAQKTAGTKPSGVSQQPATNTESTDKRRELVVKGLAALRHGNNYATSQINKELEKIASPEAKKAAATKSVDGRAPYDSQDVLYVESELDTEVARLHDAAGGLVARVTRKTLRKSKTYRRIVNRDFLGFEPAPYGKNKKVKHTNKTEFKVEVEPWAVIAAWDEEIAEDSAIDYFADVATDLSDGALFNEEFNILAFEGGTFGGRVYAKTGIVPLLNDANREDRTIVYDKTLPQKLAAAYGLIKTPSRNPKIVLAMTRTTRARIAAIQDDQGRPLYSGKSLDAGMLGEFEIEEVSERNLPNDVIVMGDWGQYTQVEKGGLKLLGSQHATLNDASLYQTDGEAIRARQRIAGGPVFIESFYLLATASAPQNVAQPVPASES